jgi:hypothetical protein
MNFKTTYILFGVLLVVLGVFAFALWYDPTSRSDKETSRYVLPGLREGEDSPRLEAVSRVEIERREPDAEKIVFERDGDTDRWTIVEPRRMTADTLAVNSLIQQLYTAVREEKADAPGSLSAWGLEPPQAVVTITKKDKTFKLNLGKVNSSGEVYALDPSRPKEPMVVKKARLSDALKPLTEFRNGDLLTSAVGDVRAVALGKGKDIDLALKQEDDGRWVYTLPKDYGEAGTGFDEPAAPGQPKAPDSMAAVLNDLAGLRAEKGDKGAAFIDDVTDFDKYNLGPKADVLRVQVTRQEQAGKDAEGKPKTSPVTATLLVGVGKETENKSGLYYARLDDDKTVVKVAKKYVDPLLELLKRKDALRDRVLVRFDKPPSVVRVKNGFGEFELVRTPRVLAGRPGLDAWTLWRDDTSRKVDPAAMQGPEKLVNLLRQTVSPPLIEAFIDRKEKKDDQEKQEAQLGLDKPRAVVSLWNEEDGVVKEESKEPDKGKEPDKSEKPKKPQLKSKEPTCRLSFGDPVSEGALNVVPVKREVRRKDGGWDVTLVKIKEAALNEARKGPLAYMDKTLERFNESGLQPWQGVTKLAIHQRGKDTIEVTRDKDSAPWTIAQPANLAGRKAESAKIDAVLRAMNNPNMALQLVSEKAKDETELDRTYGLKSPQARVEITMKKDDKPVTYTYDFGNEVGQDGGVYAKQSQRDIIFTVNKDVVASLPTDVLDPVIFTFNPADVEKVKISGWSALAWDLERKDATTWTVKEAPKDHVLDSAKVNKFLSDLQTVKASQWVAFKDGAKGNYDFALPDGGMKVELTVKGEKEPFVLTVGKADGDKGYYAMSNRSDGDVFLLPRSLFDGPKSKAKFFSP